MNNPYQFKRADFLSLLLLLALFPLMAKAQPFTYTTHNGTVTITGYIGPGGNVIIPDQIENLPVTSIGSSAFSDLTSLMGITIADSITNIGSFAFDSCASLTNIVFGNSVTRIGSYAFQSCHGLTHVAIPDSVKEIGKSAFEHCTGMSSVIIGNGIASMEDSLFSACSSLTSVTIPNSVTNLGRFVFDSCESLTNIAIPNSVKNVGEYAFYGCTSLGNVIIGDSVIGLGRSAFRSCSSLTSVTIPASVTSIGNACFANCSSLDSITMDALNSAFSSVDGVLFNKSQTTLIQCPGGKIGVYTVPNSVTKIADAAFAYCVTLTSVIIPGSVASVGGFSYCAGLTNVTLANGVANIASAAFFNCGSLGNVTIPNSVTNIEANAFFACTSLSSVTIGNGVTRIEDGAFWECPGLTQIYFQGNAPSIGLAFLSEVNNGIVYYLPGCEGWKPTFGGVPTALWALPNPLILNFGSSFGVRTNRFGFVISWAASTSVVVEACTDLAMPTWLPVGTNTLTDGSSYFSDPQWTNYPTRLYRLHSL